VELAGFVPAEPLGHWWINDTLFVTDNDEAPTYWANAELPDPPNEAADES